MEPIPNAIRRAGPADAAAVGALTRAAYAKWVPVIGREPTPMTVDADARMRDHLVDVIEANGALLALIEMVPLPGHLLIENLAVRPGTQGQGLGRRLLAHAETVAATLGLPAMRLYTNPLFAGNVQFYQRFGYTVDREEPFKGGVTVHMGKRLADPG